MQEKEFYSPPSFWAWQSTVSGHHSAGDHCSTTILRSQTQRGWPLRKRGDWGMSEKKLLTEEEIQHKLVTLPEWEVRDGWLRRKYKTPGFSHTLLLVNTIGYLAEAAWHHPDLELGYAQIIVRLQTHQAGGITMNDVELAQKIEEVVLWKPEASDSLQGYPKNWVK